MKLARRIAITLAMLVAGGFAAAAQDLAPAEVPPPAFDGNQYVDSRGCVFVRAGIDGDVTWVPRVTEAREAICGFTPTLAADAKTAEETPQDVTVAAAPAPRVQRPARVAQRRPAAVAQRRVVVTRPGEITAQTRILPKHLAEARVRTIDSVRVPNGYRTVWEDGRLNPRRAEQTLAGRHDMLLVWTQAVPRRLIDRRTGRDVTASVPLVYPYLDPAVQRRELGLVQIVRQGDTVTKRVLPKTRAAAPRPVYSSQSRSPNVRAVRRDSPGR